jgi:hypothetical protein
MTARAFDVATTHPAFTPRGFRPGRYELVRKVESSCVYVRRRPRRFGRTSFGAEVGPRRCWTRGITLYAPVARINRREELDVLSFLDRHLDLTKFLAGGTFLGPLVVYGARGTVWPSS